MDIGIIKRAFVKHKAWILKRIKGGGIDMSEMVMLRQAEPRKILQVMSEKEVPAIMSYLSKHKWHVAKVKLTELGAARFSVELLPSEKPRPMNIQVDQPVGIALKYEYGKFVFETKVVGFEPSPQGDSGGTIVLMMPDRVEIVQRRNYFRVEVPQSLKVNVLLWHRGEVVEQGRTSPEHYYQGRLVNVSAGGAQVTIDAHQEPNFKEGQFIVMRFTPAPYELPLVLNAQIRNILPTADEKNFCLGLQMVGLEASPEGHKILQRLCNIVEQYYQMEQPGSKRQDLRLVDL